MQEFFQTFNCFVRNIPYQTTTILGSERFSLAQRKLKASLCIAKTAGGRILGPVFHPYSCLNQGMAESEYLLCREQGRTALFLLKVVQQHAQIKTVLKELAFCSEYILEILAQTYHAHLHLPVHTATENFHVRIPLLGHPDLILITRMVIRCTLNMGFQHNQHPTCLEEHTRHPARVCFTPKNFLLKLFYRVLIPSMKSKVRKKRANNNKNP